MKNIEEVAGTIYRFENGEYVFDPLENQVYTIDELRTVVSVFEQYLEDQEDKKET
jgi:hypothetical protein